MTFDSDAADILSFGVVDIFEGYIGTEAASFPSIHLKEITKMVAPANGIMKTL